MIYWGLNSDSRVTLTLRTRIPSLESHSAKQIINFHELMIGAGLRHPKTFPSAPSVELIIIIVICGINFIGAWSKQIWLLKCICVFNLILRLWLIASSNILQTLIVAALLNKLWTLLLWSFITWETTGGIDLA